MSATAGLVEPVHELFGARVSGVDLPALLSEQGTEPVLRLLDRYGLLVFPLQDLSPAAQVAVSRRFGEVDLPPRQEDRLETAPEVFVIGNPGDRAVAFAPSSADGNESESSELEWHADQSQYPYPTWISLMYGVEVPPRGGDTLFACTRSAYRALDERTRNLYSGLNLLHSIHGINNYLRQQGKAEVISKSELQNVERAPQKWPLVRTDSHAAEPALYFGSHVCVGVSGWPEQEGLQLIAEVTAHSTRDEFVYRHAWAARDLVLWDNRRTVHAATSYDSRSHRRVIHRTTVQDPMPPHPAQRLAATRW